MGKGYLRRAAIGLALLGGVSVLLVLACDRLGPVEEPVAHRCEARSAPRCDVLLPGACWSHLGLDGEWVGPLAETPWGVFAGTANSGLFRLDQSHSCWVSLGLDHAQISSIVFVPGPPDRLLVGVRPYGEQQTDAAVFASEDSGATWFPSDGGLAQRNDRRFWTYSLAVAPTKPAKVFLGSTAAVLRSDDGGHTWSFVRGDERPVIAGGIRSIVVSPSRPGEVWAGGTGGIFVAYVVRFENWGERSKVFPIIRNWDNALFALGLDPRDPARLWAGMFGEIARSDDRGETWTRSLRVPGVVWALAFKGDDLYAAAAEGTRLALYRTRDGLQWDTLSVPDAIHGAYSMIVDSQGRLLIGTAGSGLWRVTLTQ